jgi:hypothetical protein
MTKEYKNANEKLKETVKRTNKWYLQAKELLVGKTITNATWQYWLSDIEDRKEYDEYATGLVLTLTDKKTKLKSFCYLSQDDEQNGPGALVVISSKPEGQFTLPVGVEDMDQHIENMDNLDNLSK